MLKLTQNLTEYKRYNDGKAYRYSYLGNLCFEPISTDGQRTTVRCLEHPAFAIHDTSYLKAAPRRYPKNCLAGMEYTFDTDTLVDVVDPQFEDLI